VTGVDGDISRQRRPAAARVVTGVAARQRCKATEIEGTRSVDGA
jgi:hypothetical protein